MTTPGPRPRRGFLSAFQAAMAPRIPDDDGSPIARPTIVTVASVVVLLAGLIFVYFGVGTISTRAKTVDQQKVLLADAGQQCRTYVGGIGSAVPSGVPTPTSASGPIAPTALPSQCAAITSDQIPEADAANFRDLLFKLGVVFALVGVAIGVAGWYLRQGYRWARRVLVTVAILALLAAALLQLPTPLTLVATLMLVIGLVMTYIGRGSVYFIQMVSRRGKHA